jgi:signal transduction histidine kinase
MNDFFVLVFSLIMLGLSAFFILFFVTWNKKTIQYQKKLSELKTKAQRELLRATIEGQEMERKRISENLHDDIGPLLSSLKIQARNLSKDPSVYNDFIETLNSAIQNVKRVSQKLSPLVFEELGLNRAVEHICHQTSEMSGIKIKLNWNHAMESHLPKQKQLGCFRIVQEAMNNVLKHARADTILLSSTIAEDGTLNILIEDNGIGMPVPDPSFSGLGIKNMEARAESMNAVLKVIALNPGTKIQLTIPKNTHA